MTLSLSLLVCMLHILCSITPDTAAIRLQHLEEVSPTRGQDSDDNATLQLPKGVFVLRTEEDAKSMVALHATDRKEVMFTTYSFTHNHHYNADGVHPVRHVWESLRTVGRMENAMMISYDEQTCQTIAQRGIPCILDRFLPQPDELTGQYKDSVPHWYQKYAWALKMLQWGYSVNFFETDQVFFRDPLPFRQPSLDLQGLSDWQRPKVPPAKERFSDTCVIYHMQKGGDGNNFLAWGAHDPKNAGSQAHINPCMSTGYWFANPTPPVQQFLEAFIDHMLHARNWQTDQILFNEFIMAFLIGDETQRAMTFSLLNTQLFSNFEVNDLRKEQNITAEPVMLHGGGMHGSTQKEEYMKEQGYWQADNWDVLAAQTHIQKLEQHYNQSSA